MLFLSAFLCGIGAFNRAGTIPTVPKPVGVVLERAPQVTDPPYSLRWSKKRDDVGPVFPAVLYPP